MLNKPNLDLLRAFAISLVILDHMLIAQNIQHLDHSDVEWIGQLGVYIFFVHTCLVLMWSLERKPHTLDFYIRRIFRIYPLAILAITVTLLFHAPVNPTAANYFSYTPASRLQIFINFLLIQNLKGLTNVIGVLWSLPVEVDMYVLLPALFFFVRKNFSLWPLLLMWTYAFLLGHHLVLFGNIFYTVIPCFLPGVMAYVLFDRTRPRLPAWLFPIFLLVLGSLFVRYGSILHSGLLCLALGLCLPIFRQVSFAPLVRVSHELAKYSYGMYLSHPFAIVIGFYLLRGHPLWLQLPVIILSTAIFSVSAYHLLEKPMINLGARVALKAERYYEQKHLADLL